MALLCAILPTGAAIAQVMVNGATNYATLTLAFTAINNGLHTGNITVRIDASIAETANPTTNLRCVTDPENYAFGYFGAAAVSQATITITP